MSGPAPSGPILKRESWFFYSSHSTRDGSIHSNLQSSLFSHLPKTLVGLPLHLSTLSSNPVSTLEWRVFILWSSLFFASRWSLPLPVCPSPVFILQSSLFFASRRSLPLPICPSPVFILQSSLFFASRQSPSLAVSPFLLARLPFPQFSHKCTDLGSTGHRTTARPRLRQSTAGSLLSFILWSMW